MRDRKRGPTAHRAASSEVVAPYREVTAFPGRHIGRTINKADNNSTFAYHT